MKDVTIHLYDTLIVIVDAPGFQAPDCKILVGHAPLVSVGDMKTQNSNEIGGNDNESSQDNCPDYSVISYLNFR